MKHKNYPSPPIRSIKKIQAHQYEASKRSKPTNIPLKKMIPTLSWQTLTLSLRVLCWFSVHGTRNERIGVCHDRVGIIFLSWGWGSVWGSSRRLQVPYVIPRPGVPRHIVEQQSLSVLTHNHINLSLESSNWKLWALILVRTG